MPTNIAACHVFADCQSPKIKEMVADKSFYKFIGTPFLET